MNEEEYNNAAILCEDETDNIDSDNEYDSKEPKISTVYSMYKILPKNKDLLLSYIGHTSNFNQRCSNHKKNTINTNDLKHYHLKVYQTIRDNGGWNAWEIIEIEKFVCSTILEARMREQQLLNEHGSYLNTCKAFITEDERKKRKQAITTKYKEDHKELIKEHQHKYKQDHKDIIKEQMDKYRKEHKEEIRKKEKEYLKLHEEKFKENAKVWREANKEILKEKRKTYNEKKKQKLLAEQLEKGI